MAAQPEEEMMVTDEMVDALKRAIEDLDAAWEYDAARGKADAIGGAEYERLSPVPHLRRLLEEITQASG